MNLFKIEDFLSERKLRRWIDPLRRAVFSGRAQDYRDVPGLPAELAGELSRQFSLLPIQGSEIRRAKDGSAAKAVLRLSDGVEIETVLLRPTTRRWTACISSQVGCALGCTFCATGLMGLRRDLTAEEITGQVLFWRQFMAREKLGDGPHNIVYMGMGEPLANYEAVAESLRSLLDGRQFGFGPSRVSVSTAGLAPAMDRFAKDFPRVNLALSLHAAEDGLRARLVPINKAYPLARLAESLRGHIKRNGRKIMLEYVLLAGENDRARDAEALAAFVASVGPSELLHVNLIVFNPTATSHAASEDQAARAFQSALRARGLKVTLRQNLGRDITGACGQLFSEAPSRQAPTRP